MSPFNKTNVNILGSSEQLALAVTAETTSLNSTNETPPIVATDILTPLATNNQNDTSNFSLLKKEAQLLVLKSYVDCELSTLTSKTDAFSDPLKNALENLQNKNVTIATLTCFSKTIHSWKMN